MRLPWGVDSVNLTQQGQIFDSLRSNPTKAGIGANVVLVAAAIDKALLEALGMPIAQGPGEGRFIVDADGAHPMPARRSIPLTVE